MKRTLLLTMVGILAVPALASAAGWAKKKNKDLAITYSVPAKWTADEAAYGTEHVLTAKDAKATASLTVMAQAGTAEDALKTFSIDPAKAKKVKKGGWMCGLGTESDAPVAVCAALDADHVTVVKLAGDPKTIKRAGGLKALIKAAPTFTGFTPAAMGETPPDGNPCGNPCGGNPCGE